MGLVFGFRSLSLVWLIDYASREDFEIKNARLVKDQKLKNPNTQDQSDANNYSSRFLRAVSSSSVRNVNWRPNPTAS